MIKLPPKENLDYTIASNLTACVCPSCGVIHHKRIELAYRDRPNIWKLGYLAILCNNCRRLDNDSDSN